jgi:hypothetical protein
LKPAGPSRLLVYCGDYKCAHSVIISAERWPDNVRLSDLEPKFTCRACGHRGADFRPLFEPARMGHLDRRQTRKPTIDLGQGARLARRHPSGMNPTDEKPRPDKEATRSKPPRLAEIRQILEDYISDLREILKKLRKHLN